MKWSVPMSSVLTLLIPTNSITHSPILDHYCYWVLRRILFQSIILLCTWNSIPDYWQIANYDVVQSGTRTIHRRTFTSPFSSLEVPLSTCQIPCLSLCAANTHTWMGRSFGVNKERLWSVQWALWLRCGNDLSGCRPQKANLWLAELANSWHY